MGFPPPGAEIYRNEAGEPTGWDIPADPTTWYCDECGFVHSGECIPFAEEDENDDEYPSTFPTDDE